MIKKLILSIILFSLLFINYTYADENCPSGKCIMCGGTPCMETYDASICKGQWVEEYQNYFAWIGGSDGCTCYCPYTPPKDPCIGVVCEKSHCDYNNLVGDGYCSNGQCIYPGIAFCDNGCENAKCKETQVIEQIETDTTCTQSTNSMESFCKNYCEVEYGKTSCTVSAVSSQEKGKIYHCSCSCDNDLPSYYNLNCNDIPTPNKYVSSNSVAPTNEDKCLNVKCKEDYCDGDNKNYNGICDKSTGQCFYQSFNCENGCENGVCKNTEVELKKLELSSEKNSIIINGKDYVTLTGKAIGISNGKEVPMKNYKLNFQTTNDKKYSLESLGLKIKGNPLIQTDENGNFEVILKSEKNINKITPHNSILTITHEKGNKISLTILSPVPIIKTLKLKNKPNVWQDSYAVFEVVVEDADNNIRSYEINSKAGKIRVYGLEYDLTASKNTADTNIEFAWKAPKFTEDMKLDYMKMIADKTKEAASKIAEEAVDTAAKNVANKAYGEGAENFIPGISEIKDFATNSKDEKANNAITESSYNYVASRKPKSELQQTKEEVSGTVSEVYSKSEEISKEVATQASELGQAYEDGGYFFEFLSRSGVIAIDGFVLYDSVYTISKEKILGQNEEKTLLTKVKDTAKEMSIDILKESLKWVADNYKAARAKKLTLPFIIKVTVTDEDGNTATKGILVEVEGYERTI